MCSARSALRSSSGRIRRIPTRARRSSLGVVARLEAGPDVELQLGGGVVDLLVAVDDGLAELGDPRSGGPRWRGPGPRARARTGGGPVVRPFAPRRRTIPSLTRPGFTSLVTERSANRHGRSWLAPSHPALGQGIRPSPFSLAPSLRHRALMLGDRLGVAGVALPRLVGQALFFRRSAARSATCATSRPRSVLLRRSPGWVRCVPFRHLRWCVVPGLVGSGLQRIAVRRMRRRPTRPCGVPLGDLGGRTSKHVHQT